MNFGRSYSAQIASILKYARICREIDTTLRFGKKIGLGSHSLAPSSTTLLALRRSLVVVDAAIERLQYRCPEVALWPSKDT